MPSNEGPEESARLKVALCIGQLEPGGAERCLAQLAVGLDRRRFEPVVYCLGRPPRGPQAVLHEQLTAAGVPTYFLGVRPRWRLLSATLRLSRALRHDRPDIVQTFLHRANIVGALAARFARVPHVVAGVRVADPRGRLRLHIERFATRSVDRFVCVSQSVADFCRDIAKLPPPKLLVIPNGVDAARFRDAPSVKLAELGVAPRQRALGVIGRIDRQKGVDWLLRLAPDLLSALPRHDLLIVGDGPLRRKLEQFSREKRLEGRIHFTGWRGDVPQILAACDLLILPSAWEGMPNVLLEAMAAGRPVVACEAEGVWQVLGSLTPQQVVPLGDAKLLRERVVAIVSNPELATRLGRENRLRAESQFSVAEMIGTYEQLYLSLTRHTAR